MVPDAVFAKGEWEGGMGGSRRAFLPQYISVCVTWDWGWSGGNGRLGFWGGAAETVEGTGTGRRDATGI
jgi:hypothetical protein